MVKTILHEFKQTEIGEVPQDWDIVPFGDFATLQRGYDLPVQNRVKGKVPIIGSNGVVGYHKVGMCTGPGVITGRSGTIGLSVYQETEYWPLNTSLYVSDFHENNPCFVHFFFQYFNFKKYAGGVSVPTLNRNMVYSALVAIPKVIEQEKIAGVLSQLQKAVENQGKIVSELRELKAAMVAKLFREGLRGESLKQTEIGEVPESWDVRPFGKFITLQRGHDLPVQKREVGNIPVIGSNGIVGYHRVSAYKGPGVLTGRSGTIGLSFYMADEYWPLNTSLFVSGFHGNNPKFIHYFFQQFNFKKYSGGVSVPTLNRNLVHFALIAFPKLQEQQDIAAILTKLDGNIAQTNKKLQNMQTLFSSTLNQLMTGKVRIKE